MRHTLHYDHRWRWKITCCIDFFHDCTGFSVFGTYCIKLFHFNEDQNLLSFYAFYTKISFIKIDEIFLTNFHVLHNFLIIIKLTSHLHFRCSFTSLHDQWFYFYHMQIASFSSFNTRFCSSCMTLGFFFASRAINWAKVLYLILKILAATAMLSVGFSSKNCFASIIAIE